METARVEVSYRPLRLAWLVHSGDRESFRKAVRNSMALWGGLYNPIVLADRPEAGNVIECFRPDILIPIGDHDEIREVMTDYDHLNSPIYEGLPFGHAVEGLGARCLDILNLLAHWEDKPAWKQFTGYPFWTATWEEDDPLSDLFLVQFGGYPSASEAGVDYQSLALHRTNGQEVKLQKNALLPEDLLDHPTIVDLAGFGLSMTYPKPVDAYNRGFYGGSSTNIEDLVNFWNLRALGLELAFLDLVQPSRLTEMLATYEAEARSHAVVDSATGEQLLPLWAREENREALSAWFGSKNIVSHVVDHVSWNGYNLEPATLSLGSSTALGVISSSKRAQRISFSLNDRPYADAYWLQALAVDVSVHARIGDGDTFTFLPPYVPELNRFAARRMLNSIEDLRIQRQSLGVIIDTEAHGIELDAIPVPALIEAFFELAGFKAKLSGGGLIARQLIAMMGGVDDTRAFKIPGVRRLLRTHGPTSSFTRKSAIQLIGQKDPDNPKARFDDHKNLYIEPRGRGDLTPSMVFSHLVEKGVFRKRCSDRTFRISA